jgi:KDO2-lipid IV(A) lauroyltransferase
LAYLEQAHARGKGVIFATGHLGNWELSAYAHALLSRPMNVVVRPLDNPLLEAFVERRRSLSGNTILSKREFLRPVLKALARNEAVGILIDHNALPADGEFVDFFGVPACSNSGFAKLAARSGAAVVPGFAFWSAPERRYLLTFYPEIPITGDALADTAAVQQCVEQAVRAHPGQWLWIHRRWKTRPPGEAAIY